MQTMIKRFIICVIFTLFAISCSKEPLANTLPSTTLYIYGGRDGEVYLGKLNGSKLDSESIWNSLGTYGSYLSTESIWNEYGTYGSEFSTYSPFNEYASNPPVLIDQNGKSYGYFTANKYKPNRANYELIDKICDNHKRIRKDVGKWYDKLFF